MDLTMLQIMRKIMTIAAMCALSIPVVAQDTGEVQPGFRHTLGLNTTGLLNQFRDDNADDPLKTPYLITYSVELGKLAMRVGIGPEYSSETIVRDGFTDSEENTLLRMDGRIGAGLVVVNDHRWQAIAGLDAVTGYFRERKIEDSGFDRVTDQEEIETFGGGPFIQLAFQISKRISLSAESAVYWQHQKTTQTQLFENFPDFNNVINENSGSDLEITLPNTIFVRIHF